MGVRIEDGHGLSTGGGVVTVNVVREEDGTPAFGAEDQVNTYTQDQQVSPAIRDNPNLTPTAEARPSLYVLQPLPRGLNATRVITERRPRTALPIESLQHPLSVYESLLEVAA
mgnify:CR=1 FL=1